MTATALAIVTAMAVAGLYAGTVLEVQTPRNTLTSQQEEAGWRLLFDGENPEKHWRGYNSDEFPSGWQVGEDGWLALAEPGAGDIITRDQFESFELVVEWKVVEGANSGIFYLVQEVSDRIWHSAPEYQILDNAADQSPVTAAGSLFDLIGSLEWDEVARPLGEVNTARVVKKGNYVEHHMNGRMLFSFEIGSAEWNRIVESSKFANRPFAATQGGHIGLQDHGDRVFYRNIWILSSF